MKITLKLSFNLVTFLFLAQNTTNCNVEISRFPWIVSLYNHEGHFCIGTIISKRLVLTAASCVEWKSYQSFRIRVGSKRYLTGGKLLSLAEVISHPDYDQDTHHDDVAILVTKKDIEFDKYVKPMRMTAQDMNETTSAIIVGWFTRDDRLGFDLQCAQTNTIAAEECADRIHTLFIKDEMICTHLNKFNPVLCKGDTGGPLIINETLHGVLSWGGGCPPPDNPAVFMAVHYFNDWVKEVAAKRNLSLNPDFT